MSEYFTRTRVRPGHTKSITLWGYFKRFESCIKTIAFLDPDFLKSPQKLLHLAKIIVDTFQNATMRVIIFLGSRDIEMMCWCWIYPEEKTLSPDGRPAT